MFQVYNSPAVLRVLFEPFQTLTEVGGKRLRLYGTNLTGDFSYVVRFTQLNAPRPSTARTKVVEMEEEEEEEEFAPASSYAVGIYDQGRGYIVVPCPPMTAGLVRLSIGINRQQFT